MSTKLHVKVSKIHKWLALIIGVQVLLWVTSGSVMSILPIETVRGEHLVSRDAPALSDLTDVIAPDKIGKDTDGSIKSIRYRQLLDEPIIEVIDAQENALLFNARTGERRATISAWEARQIATSAWLDGSPNFRSVRKINKNSIEYKGLLPAWLVETDDDTRIFIPVATGEIKAVRSSTWRLYDFFWSLHIMDWENHENFNSWWLISFALGGVFMALSGMVLLVKRWPIKKLNRKAKQ